MAQRLKCLPTMRETWVRSLSREDPLETEMATHPSTLAWKIPWIEEPYRLQSMGSAKSDTTERLHFNFSNIIYITSSHIPQGIKESYDQPRQHIIKQRHYFSNKDPSTQGYGFSSGYVWM